MKPLSDLLKPVTVTNTCRDCGRRFEVKNCAAWFVGLVCICKTCGDKHAAEESQRAAAEAAQRRNGTWEQLCPSNYRQTDPASLPRPDLLARVLAWKFGPRGLLLHGPTGRGKSRCAWLLLKREFESGRSIAAADHSIGFRYAEAYKESAAAAAAWIDKLSAVEILFLDDVFKARLTDSLESALFTVIANRGEQGRPTIIATNDTGSSLTLRLSTDRGEALVRRLMEGTERVPFV